MNCTVTQSTPQALDMHEMATVHYNSHLNTASQCVPFQKYKIVLLKENLILNFYFILVEQDR